MPRVDGRLHGGRHAHLCDIGVAEVAAAARLEARRVRQARAPSPRRRMGCRRPRRRSPHASSLTEDAEPSSSSQQRRRCPNHSGGQARSCGRRVPASSAPWYSGREVISTIDGVRGMTCEEVGHHRLADLVDPVRVLDDVQRGSGAGQQRRHSPTPSTAADGHPGRSAEGQHRGRRCPAGHRTSSRSSVVGLGTRSRTRTGRPRRSSHPRPLAGAQQPRHTRAADLVACDSQKVENTSHRRAVRRSRHRLADQVGSCRCPAVPPHRPPTHARSLHGPEARRSCDTSSVAPDRASTAHGRLSRAPRPRPISR